MTAAELNSLSVLALAHVATPYTSYLCAPTSPDTASTRS